MSNKRKDYLLCEIKKRDVRQNVTLPNERKRSQMNQTGNIKGAYTEVERNTENLKVTAALYYRVERDGLDEMSMCGLVWVDIISMGWGRVCRKGCSRLSLSGVCEQGGAG